MLKLILLQFCLLLNYLLHDSVYAQSTCDFIKKVKSYQNDVKLKYESKTLILDSLSFNLDIYLKMFNNLKLDSGKIGKVYYDELLLSGKPIIYVVPKSFNLDEYIERITKKILNEKPPIPYLIVKEKHNAEDLKRLNLSRFVSDPQVRAFNNLIPDNSAEGFFQYLFFYVMGEQFALMGHSNLDQKYILCTNEDIIAVIKSYSKNELFVVHKKQLNLLRKIDPTPIIELDESLCRIIWYELETHRGLFQKTYEIERKAPYKVREAEKNQIFDISLNFDY